MTTKSVYPTPYQFVDLNGSMQAEDTYDALYESHQRLFELEYKVRGQLEQSCLEVERLTSLVREAKEILRAVALAMDVTFDKRIDNWFKKAEEVE